MNTFAKISATLLLSVASIVLAQTVAPAPAERPTAFAEGAEDHYHGLNRLNPAFAEWYKRFNSYGWT